MNIRVTSGYDNEGSLAHSDVFQLIAGGTGGDDANIVAQNIRVFNAADDVQTCLFSITPSGSFMENMLLRDVLIDRVADGVGDGAFGGGPWRHVLFEHWTTNNARLRMTLTGADKYVLCAFRGNVMSATSSDVANFASVAVSDNHWRSSFGMGLGKTSGGVAADLFTDPATDDFTAKAAGTLKDRVSVSEPWYIRADLGALDSPTGPTAFSLIHYLYEQS